MKKNIKDYLHLYLGCEVSFHLIGTTAILTTELLHEVSKLEHLIKPILRPLSDMTEEECAEYTHKTNTVYDISNQLSDQIRTEAATTKYLLSLGFDLFGLIESGLAVSKIESL